MSNTTPLRPVRHGGNADRIPPQNLEAEKSVLGGFLLSNEALTRASDLVKPEDFYRGAHQIIFTVMRDLHERGEPVDLLTLSETLNRRGMMEQAGGPAYLVELTEAVPTAANTEHYARIVAEKSTLRKLIDVTTQIAGRAYDNAEGPDELVFEAEGSILAIAQGNVQQKLSSVESILPEAIKKLNELFDSRGQVTGIPTGFTKLDKMTSGLQPGALIILAARPGMGKTSLILNMASNAAVYHGKNIAFFSLEMTKEELVTRLLTAEAKIDITELRNGTMPSRSWESLTRAATKLNAAPIYFDDRGGMDIRYIIGKCRRQKAEGKLDMVVIDYLQLMSGTGRTERREQEISEISRGLKGMAKDLKVPVIALSQLNRGVESRPDKRPHMADLRESGAIEQDADMIGFIYRHEVYEPNDVDAQGKAEFIIAKHRAGPIGTINLAFQAQFTRFEDLAEENMIGDEPVWDDGAEPAWDE